MFPRLDEEAIYIVGKSVSPAVSPASASTVYIWSFGFGTSNTFLSFSCFPFTIVCLYGVYAFLLWLEMDPGSGFCRSEAQSASYFLSVTYTVMIEGSLVVGMVILFIFLLPFMLSLYTHWCRSDSCFLSVLCGWSQYWWESAEGISYILLSSEM